MAARFKLTKGPANQVVKSMTRIPSRCFFFFIIHSVRFVASRRLELFASSLYHLLRGEESIGKGNLTHTQLSEKSLPSFKRLYTNDRSLSPASSSVNSPLQDRRNREIDVFAHCLACQWISRQLNHRQSRIANDIPLASREQVYRCTGRCPKRDRLSRSGRRVHEPQPFTLVRFGRLQYTNILRLPSDLLQIAKCLLLDSGQTTPDVSLGRLGSRQIVLLVQRCHFMR